MAPLYKLVFLVIMAACFLLAGYKIYVYFNEKIISSRTLPQLLLFTFLMISVNFGLLFGGVAAVLILYDLMSGVL